MIRLEHIVKEFHPKKDTTVRAVNDVSLEIEDGEIFGIIGFSGAGKSTLVRCINLLERPTSGKVFLGDKELTALSDKELLETRRSIGMIFQHFNLMPSRTVMDNVMLPLKHSTLSKQEKREKCLKLLKLVELEDKCSNYPAQLSGGQKQRVAIARALANDPKVLLCDEATSALDPQTTHQILGLLKQLNESLKLTIVIITHQMSVVKDICDRAAVMENGEVKETGRVFDIFNKPQAPITRGFIENATTLGSFNEFFKKGQLPGLVAGSDVWFLTFTGECRGQALIAKIAEKFQVEANIIYGNIDFLKGEVLGKLVVCLSGTRDNIEKSREYLTDCGVEIEVLQGE